MLQGSWIEGCLVGQGKKWKLFFSGFKIPEELLKQLEEHLSACCCSGSRACVLGYVYVGFQRLGAV